MIKIYAIHGVPIKIGRLGENNCRGIYFPELNGLLEMYPDADVAILNKRPNDPDAYPVNPDYIEIDDGEICWRVQSGDLTYVGEGKCEVIISKDLDISKSFIYDTEILEALDGSGDPPEPWTSWQQDLIENANRAEAAAELLENPEAEAVTLQPGEPATASYEDGKFTFGVPEGRTGAPGAKGDPGNDYVITPKDYQAIADDVVRSQGLQKIVTDATDAANLARNWADGKNLDGSDNTQHSEKQMTYYAQRKSIQKGVSQPINNRYGDKREMERQFHLYCANACDGTDYPFDVDSIEWGSVEGGALERKLYVKEIAPEPEPEPEAEADEQAGDYADMPVLESAT